MATGERQFVHYLWNVGVIIWRTSSKWGLRSSNDTQSGVVEGVCTGWRVYHPSRQEETCGRGEGIADNQREGRRRGTTRTMQPIGPKVVIKPLADVLCRKWLGLSALRTNLMVVGGMLLGGAMEFVMIKMWVKDTNFYKTVLNKEAERRAELQQTQEEGKPFVTVLKEQWEAKKRETELAKSQKQ
eukprot:scaffold3805_cov63-Phaeocystis_antarctica.AAC.1